MSTRVGNPCARKLPAFIIAQIHDSFYPDRELARPISSASLHTAVRLYGTEGPFVLKTETVKVEVDYALVKRFRKRAMEVYEYRKGSMKKALEDTMKRFSTVGGVDWGAIRGALKDKKTSSVKMQHKTWSRID